VFAGCSPYVNRVKTCALNKHPGGFSRNSRRQPTKHTGNAHGFGAIANHEVVGRKFTFNPIEGDEWGSLCQRLYHHPSSGNGIGIERMQRLSHLVEHIVGNINNVVDGIYAYGL